MWQLPNPAEHWQQLEEVPHRAQEIVARLGVSLHSADDGTIAITVRRRRDDATSAALGEVKILETRVRQSFNRLRAALEGELAGRMFDAELLADDHEDSDDEGNAVEVAGRWPLIRTRLELAVGRQATRKAIRTIAREYGQTRDTDALVVLRYELRGYLVGRRLWTGDDVAALMPTIDEAETIALGEPPPEVQIGNLHERATAAWSVLAQTRREIAALRSSHP